MNTYQEIVADMLKIQRAMKSMIDKVSDETSDSLKEEVMTLLNDNDIKHNLKSMEKYKKEIDEMFD